MTKNINYLQFLEIISGAKQFEKYTFVIAKDFEITGTIEQLEAVADNSNFNELKRQINKLSKKASKEITETEIIKYLKDLTSDFDTELVRAALKELEIFTSEFNETLFTEAKEYYILNNKKIPTYKKVGKDKKVVIFENQDEMINEVFPFQKWNLSIAKNWLESKLDKNSNNITKAKNALTLQELALLYYYKDIQITEANGNEMLKGTGLTSGKKLYDWFIKYTARDKRTCSEGTETKDKNKIKRLKKIIELLPEDKGAKAKDELRTLIANINKQY